MLNQTLWLSLCLAELQLRYVKKFDRLEPVSQEIRPPRRSAPPPKRGAIFLGYSPPRGESPRNIAPQGGESPRNIAPL